MTAVRSPGATAGFRHKYSAALAAHLAEPSEVTLHEAYELGRAAVSFELAILDVAGIHHEALAECARDGGLERAEQAAIAGEFLVESLSAFEMVHRGYREAREQTALEQWSGTLLRRLSSLLSDESLAGSSRESLGEALQLVAEQARELVGAARCTVRTNADACDLALEVTSSDDVDHGSDDRDCAVVPLRALRGGSLGSLEVVAAEGVLLTDRDKQVLGHVAEMASAAIERLQLYRVSRPRPLT